MLKVSTFYYWQFALALAAFGESHWTCRDNTYFIPIHGQFLASVRHACPTGMTDLHLQPCFSVLTVHL